MPTPVPVTAALGEVPSRLRSMGYPVARSGRHADDSPATRLSVARMWSGGPSPRPQALPSPASVEPIRRPHGGDAPAAGLGIDDALPQTGSATRSPEGRGSRWPDRGIHRCESASDWGTLLAGDAAGDVPPDVTIVRWCDVLSLRGRQTHGDHQGHPTATGGAAAGTDADRTARADSGRRAGDPARGDPAGPGAAGTAPSVMRSMTRRGDRARRRGGTG